MPEERNFLFVLSPNAGILDSWLPVLDRLARIPYVKIHAILPRPRATLYLRGSDFMIRKTAKTFASVHFCAADGQWGRARNLVQARRKLVCSNWKQRLFGPSSGTSSCTQAGLSQYEPGAELEATRSHLEKAGLHRPEGMLCDVSESQKTYFSGLLQATPQSGIHSVSQAVSLRELRADQPRPVSQSLPSYICERIETQFLLGESEKTHYQSKYGLLPGQIVVSGVFRHDPAWIAQVQAQTVNDGLKPGRYIFLVSRPVNPRYLPLSEKQRIIRMVHEQARKRGLTLVIRPHPFEGNRREFDRLIGPPGKQNHWIETGRHPLDIGFKCALSVTLNSSVAVDMAAMGVPVIDPVDYAKLQEDSPSTRFDDLGSPISTFAESGIAVGAKDEASFRRAMDGLLEPSERFEPRPSEEYRNL